MLGPRYWPSDLLRFVGICAAAHSGIVLASVLLGCEYIDAFETVIQGISSGIDKIFSFLEPAIIYFFKLVGMSFEPHIYWRYVLIALLVYYAAEMRTELYRTPPRPVNRIVLPVFGFSIAFFTSAIIGHRPLQDKSTDLVSEILAPLGFVFYLSLAILLTSSLYPPKGQQFLSTVKYYFKSQLLPYLTFAIISIPLSIYFSYAYGRPTNGIAGISIFLFLHALLFLQRGLRLGLTAREFGEETFWQRFVNSGSTATAFNVLAVFGVVLLATDAFTEADTCLAN